MDNNFKMVAKTLFGFEEILAKELRYLGAQNVETGVRMVSFYGDKGFMYKANLALRTALKILKPIKEFRVFNDKSLYKGIQNIDWSEYISENQTFVIRSEEHTSELQSRENLVCRLLLEKKKKTVTNI